MRLPSLAGFTVLLLVAAGMYRSRDLTWAGADLADGTRYKVSPGGISHVLEPTAPFHRPGIAAGASRPPRTDPAPGRPVRSWR